MKCDGWLGFFGVEDLEGGRAVGGDGGVNLDFAALPEEGELAWAIELGELDAELDVVDGVGLNELHGIDVVDERII